MQRVKVGAILGCRSEGVLEFQRGRGRRRTWLVVHRGHLLAPGSRARQRVRGLGVRAALRPARASARRTIADERFATPDDKFLMAKARWKQAVIKVLTKLQAYHIYEKIKRNKYCVIPVARFVKGYTRDAADKNKQGLTMPTPNKSMIGSMHGDDGN